MGDGCLPLLAAMQVIVFSFSGIPLPPDAAMYFAKLMLNDAIQNATPADFQ